MPGLPLITPLPLRDKALFSQVPDEMGLISRVVGVAVGGKALDSPEYKKENTQQKSNLENQLVFFILTFRNPSRFRKIDEKSWSKRVQGVLTEAIYGGGVVLFQAFFWGGEKIFTLAGTVLSGSVKPQMGIVVPQMGEVPKPRESCRCFLAFRTQGNNIWFLAYGSPMVVKPSINIIHYKLSVSYSGKNPENRLGLKENSSSNHPLSRAISVSGRVTM